MSGEHIWPTWFGELIDGLDRGPMTISGIGETRPTPTAAPITVRKVCIVCNTGWMNDLEKAVRPFISAMILANGDSHELTAVQQNQLASYAVMKAMLMTLLVTTDYPGLAIPKREFRKFYKHRRPSKGVTFVWIAAYKGDRKVGGGEVKFLADDAAGPLEGYFATFYLHRLIIQVLDVYAIAKHKFTDNRESMIRIWPTQKQPVKWPWNNTAYNDHELDLLGPPPVRVVNEYGF